MPRNVDYPRQPHEFFRPSRLRPPVRSHQIGWGERVTAKPKVGEVLATNVSQILHERSLALKPKSGGFVTINAVPKRKQSSRSAAHPLPIHHRAVSNAYPHVLALPHHPDTQSALNDFASTLVDKRLIVHLYGKPVLTRSNPRHRHRLPNRRHRLPLV